MDALFALVDMTGLGSQLPQPPHQDGLKFQVRPEAVLIVASPWIWTWLLVLAGHLYLTDEKPWFSLRHDLKISDQAKGAVTIPHE